MFIDVIKKRIQISSSHKLGTKDSQSQLHSIRSCCAAYSSTTQVKSCLTVTTAIADLYSTKF